MFDSLKHHVTVLVPRAKPCPA